MMNQIVLVGRLENIEFDNDYAHITLRCPRPSRNEAGIYDSDSLCCIFKLNNSVNLREVCNIDDVIGIKGRLENKDGNLIVKAEKLTFLSSKTQSVSNYE